MAEDYAIANVPLALEQRLVVLKEIRRQQNKTQLLRPLVDLTLCPQFGPC